MNRKAASPDPASEPVQPRPGAPAAGMMNDGSRVLRRPRRAWPPTARTAVGIVAIAAVALLAACSASSPSAAGPGGPSNAPASASSTSAVGYSACMRVHGLPGYPDPTSGGGIPKESAQHLGVSSSQFYAAQRACQHLLPATGGSLTASSLQQCYLAGVCPQALVQQAMNAGLEFARCMRSHTVPDWPDPTIDSQGRPLYNIHLSHQPPRHVSTAITECSRLEHPGSLLAWG